MNSASHKILHAVLVIIAILSLSACQPVIAAGLHIEAEGGTLAGGVAVSTSTAGYTGAGYVSGFTGKQSTVTVKFAAKAGLYDLRFRYRSASGQKGYDASVNGSGFSGMFAPSISFRASDPTLVTLKSGDNSITIGGGWGWYDIDAVDLSPAKPIARPRRITAPPVDSKSTPEARKLLSYLESVYGRSTLSGQQDLPEAQYVQKVTGTMPAIVVTDLIEYSPSRIKNGSKPAGAVEKAVGLGKSGNIVGLMWHWNAPMDLTDSKDQPWWKGFYTAATSFRIDYAMAHPDSPGYRALISDMDTISVQIAKLDKAHIPVLWRPLHEASGGWFWWGAHGPQPFIQLWRLMYHRLVDVHHLHNLIWVYTDGGDPAWYPGDRYVDIVGTDQYPADRADLLTGVWRGLTARFDGKKMLALAEFKTVPEIEKMHSVGVWWDYFVPWVGDLGPKDMAVVDVARIYKSPGVVTKNRLPRR